MGRLLHPVEQARLGRICAFGHASLKVEVPNELICLEIDEPMVGLKI